MKIKNMLEKKTGWKCKQLTRATNSLVLIEYPEFDSAFARFALIQPSALAPDKTSKKAVQTRKEAEA